MSHSGLRVLQATTYAQATDDTCPGCGEPVPRYVRFCPECGFSLRSPTSDEPIDLEATPTAGVFRLAHLSDLHLSDTPQGNERLAVFEAWLKALARCHVDGLVVTGDLCEVPDRVRFRMAWVLLRDSGLRWAVIPGNHDVERPGQPGAFSEIFGEYPRVERWGPLELVLLDSNAGLAVEDRSTLEGGMGRLKCFTEGRVGLEQLARVEAQLGQGVARVGGQGQGQGQGQVQVQVQVRVMLLHHHLSPQHAERLGPLVDDTLLGTMGVLKDADAVRCWAMEHQVALVLHGHKHAMLRTGMLGGEILILNGGSSTQGPRPRIRLVDFLEGNHRRVVDVELT